MPRAAVPTRSGIYQRGPSACHAGAMSWDRTGTSCVKARCLKARVLRAAATGGVLTWLLLVRAPDAIALEPGAEVLPPHALYGELFTRVQEAQVFPDGKDFCDALPK